MALPPATWASDHFWTHDTDGGSLIDRPLVDVVQTASGLTLALDNHGGVHLRTQTGWLRTLEPLVPDVDDDAEELLLDVESAVEDLIDLADDEAEIGVDSTADGDLRVGLDLPEFEDLSDAFEMGMLEAERQAEQLAGTGGGLWTVPGMGDAIIVERADARWWSGGGGVGWTRVRGLGKIATLVDLPGPGAAVVAGTDAGIRLSADRGRSWMWVQGDLSDTSVEAISVVDDRLYAVADGALWTSLDGVDWDHMGPESGVLRAHQVLSDPHWSGGFWGLSPEGVIRSDDGGATWSRSGRHAFSGMTELVLLGRGHLLVAGADGVWESVDGGMRWRPLPRGLSRPEVLGLSHAPAGTLVATAQGLYSLGRTPELAEVDVGADLAPAMGVVVEVALRQATVGLEPLVVQRAIARSLWTPRVQIVGVAERERSIGADLVALGNDGDRDYRHEITLRLCMGLCEASTVAMGGMVEGGAFVDGAFYAVNGEVYATDSHGSVSAAAAKVVHGLTQYRTHVAETVVDIYDARARLVAQQAAQRGAPLRERINLELAVQEANARLDIYTNGFFTQALQGA